VSYETAVDSRSGKIQEVSVEVLGWPAAASD
jgi:hypothetical protein